jgi:iron complex outermembrane receptor protein
MVPGLDVMEITSSQFEINPRGLSGPLTNRLLILIDGRTVYIDFFGGTNWESFPVSLDEIKKIEVVKGPASALWGANAFSGVINIITKTPNEIEGGLVSGVGGENSFSSSSFIYGRTLKNLGFKVSAGWKGLNEFKDRFTYLSDKKSERGMKFNSTFDYLLNKDSQIKLEGGWWDGKVETYAGAFPRKLGADLFNTFLKIEYGLKNLNLRAYRNMGEIILLKAIDNSRDIQIEFRTYDLEFKHNFSINSRNSLNWGCNYRLNSEKSNQLNRVNQRNLFALFFQEEYKPNSIFSFIFGARLDDQPLFRQNLSSQGAILLSPWKNHIFKIQGGNAFKNPTIVDTEVSLLVKSIPLLSPPLPFSAKTDLFWQGNQSLIPERIVSYQIGYLGAFGNLSCDLDLFLNKIENLISLDSIEIAEILVDLATQQPIYHPQTGEPIPTKINFLPTNRGKVKTFGGELALNYRIAKQITSFGSYSFQQLKDEITGRIIKSSPAHKINLGMRFQSKLGLSLSGTWHYVSKTEWPVDTDSDFVSDEKVTLKPYTLLNLRAGYLFLHNRTEVFISAFNALDHKHQEYFKGEEIGRRIAGGLTLKF